VPSRVYVHSLLDGLTACGGIAVRLIRIDAWADCNTGTGSVLECLIKLCQYCLSATCEALVFIGASGHRQRFQVSMRERGSSSAPCASALDALVLVQRTTTVVQ
jgi:hypothetical protein